MPFRRPLTSVIRTMVPRWGGDDGRPALNVRAEGPDCSHREPEVPQGWDRWHWPLATPAARVRAPTPPRRPGRLRWRRLPAAIAAAAPAA